MVELLQMVSTEGMPASSCIPPPRVVKWLVKIVIRGLTPRREGDAARSPTRSFYCDPALTTKQSMNKTVLNALAKLPEEALAPHANALAAVMASSPWAASLSHRCLMTASERRVWQWTPPAPPTG